MKYIKWQQDDLTAYWADRLPNPATWPIQPQYDGSNRAFHEASWLNDILSPRFPEHCRHPLRPGCLLCSPDNIVQCFKDRKVLEGLALTVAWGAMTRQKPRIYTVPLPQLQDTLLSCLDSISATDSVQVAWDLLTGTLGWSDVMASKSLHFIARSLGYETNPPVPIDNKVVLQCVWPHFWRLANRMRQLGDPEVPGCWRENAYAWGGYNRYMTAINCWAQRANWSTSQLESTIFKQFYP